MVRLGKGVRISRGVRCRVYPSTFPLRCINSITWKLVRVCLLVEGIKVATVFPLERVDGDPPRV